jgi:uroporphyrinogen-III synthase
MPMINVLSTKALDSSVIEKAKSKEIHLQEQDAILIKPILSKEKWNEIFFFLQKRIQYAVFTSSNAVIALKRYLNNYVNHLPPQWEIFCLSGKTKEALQKSEEAFGTITGTAATATELAKQVIAHGVKELLFFCGDRRRDELPEMLQAAGVTVHEIVVYEVEATPTAVEGEFDAVLFFSPSAVQSFFAANQLKESTICFAIGHTTGRSVQQATRNELVISQEPTQEALLQAVINYFQKG